MALPLVPTAILVMILVPDPSRQVEQKTVGAAPKPRLRARALNMKFARGTIDKPVRHCLDPPEVATVDIQLPFPVRGA